MKPLLRKIPAMIAMLIGLVSLVWYVQSFFDTVYTEIWIGSVIMAILSMPFFLIDAVISLVRAIKKDDPKFNYLLALILIGGIPMVAFVGGDGRTSVNMIWNVYYLLMYVLEVISIKKAAAAVKAARKKAEETAEN